MPDQIAIQVAKTNWTEGSAFTATAYFRDRATSAASAPSTVKYRIDCLTTKTTVLDWTSASAGSSVAISVTAANNAIVDASNPYERKQLTVAADPDTSSQHRASFTWNVSNLRGSP